MPCVFVRWGDSMFVIQFPLAKGAATSQIPLTFHEYTP